MKDDSTKYYDLFVVLKDAFEDVCYVSYWANGWFEVERKNKIGGYVIRLRHEEILSAVRAGILDTNQPGGLPVDTTKSRT